MICRFFYCLGICELSFGWFASESLYYCCTGLFCVVVLTKAFKVFIV